MKIEILPAMNELTQKSIKEQINIKIQIWPTMNESMNKSVHKTIKKQINIKIEIWPTMNESAHKNIKEQINIKTEILPAMNESIHKNIKGQKNINTEIFTCNEWINTSEKLSLTNKRLIKDHIAHQLEEIFSVIFHSSTLMSVEVNAVFQLLFDWLIKQQNRMDVGETQPQFQVQF